MVPVRYTSQMPTRSAQSGQKFRLGFISARFIGILLLALFGLIYLAQMSQASSKQVQLHDLQSQDDMLEQDQRQLQLESTRLRSLSTIDQNSLNLGLQPVQNVEHVSK